MGRLDISDILNDDMTVLEWLWGYMNEGQSG